MPPLELLTVCLSVTFGPACTACRGWQHCVSHPRPRLDVSNTPKSEREFPVASRPCKQGGHVGCIDSRRRFMAAWGLLDEAGHNFRDTTVGTRNRFVHTRDPRDCRLGRN